MKFVVFKGTAGWGDRLQCLLQVVRYAKATGRWLVVDWRDNEWAHSGLEGFDDYCHLQGVRSMQLHAFLDLFENTPIKEKVFPAVWQHHMQHHDFKEWLYTPLFCTADHGRAFDDIGAFRQEDFVNQVVVYAGTGFRSFAYADFGHVVLHRWLAQQFVDFARQQQLVAGEYDVVHLRGGSKKWAGGHVALQNLAQAIDAQFPDLGIYLNAVQQNLQAARAAKGGAKPLVVLSDSRWLAEQYIARFNEGRYLTHSFQTGMVGSGIHEATEADLKARGTSKYVANAESLRDFAVMLNARTVGYDGISLFSAMAKSCAEFSHSSWRF